VGGNLSALEQSLLGVLALMVGFSFLMALTRFETRRESVLNEETRSARRACALACRQNLTGRNR
jgi:hypothetical protein